MAEKLRIDYNGESFKAEADNYSGDKAVVLR